jgi:hypothetical protein
MNFMTMRLLFHRDAVLGLLDELAFKDCLVLIAECDVQPVRDVYLAVFVLEVEPVPDRGLKLRPVSTTAVGVTRALGKRMIGCGFLWADARPNSPSMDLLRAHFRGEDAFLHKTLMDIGLPLPVWRNHYRNGAGDLEPVPEIIVRDPGAEEMERLFGSDIES